MRFTQAKTEQNVQRLYRYLVAYHQKHGFPPTYREIQNEIGFASISQVHNYLLKLEKRKLILLTPNVVRGITLLKPKPSEKPIPEATRSLEIEAQRYTDDGCLLYWSGSPKTGVYTGFKAVRADGAVTVVGEVK